MSSSQTSMRSEKTGPIDLTSLFPTCNSAVSLVVKKTWDCCIYTNSHMCVSQTQIFTATSFLIKLNLIEFYLERIQYLHIIKGFFSSLFFSSLPTLHTFSTRQTKARKGRLFRSWIIQSWPSSWVTILWPFCSNTFIHSYPSDWPNKKDRNYLENNF